MCDQSGLNIMASEKGLKCKNPNVLCIMFYVTCWGLPPCETSTSCQRFGETCYLHVQTQSVRIHITVENPSWCHKSKPCAWHFFHFTREELKNDGHSGTVNIQ